MKKDGDGIAPQSMLFPESTVGRVEAPFKELLETGRLPETDVKNIPEAYMISYKWIPRLKAAAESRDANWNELMHYGIAVYEYQNTSVYLNESFDEKEDAEQTRIAKWAFESSLSKKENVWSLRNLAMIARQGGDDAKAEQLYDKALSVDGAFSDYALASEYLFYLVKLEKYEKAYSLFEALPDDIKTKDRIRITTSKAAIKTKNYDFVEKFLAEDHYDIQEGETTPTDVWFEYCARKLLEKDGIINPDEKTLESYIDRAWDECPPDPKIDFRMAKSKKNRYRI